LEFFDASIESLPFPSGTFHAVIAPWKLDSIVDMRKALQEIARVSKRASFPRIIIIQGAPDNEVVQFLNTTPGLLEVDHQGQCLYSTRKILADEGFEDVSIRRLRAHYHFYEKDLSGRCNAAAKLLLGKNVCMEYQEELMSRLRLHFQGSEYTMGYDLVALEARPLAN
jgi:hypothetical protein